MLRPKSALNVRCPLYGVMFKVTLFLQQDICCNYITKRLSKLIDYYLLHLQMSDDMTQPHKKALSQSLIVAHSILIRLKQTLSLQNTEI